VLGTPYAGISAPESGAMTITGIPEGRYTLAPIGQSALPPFFEAPFAIPIDVPTAGPVYFPLTLPTDDNAHYRYLTMGDSITAGEGATRLATSYVGLLEDMLVQHFRRARVVIDAIPGSVSKDGAERIENSLAHYGPTYVTILYGTNDWVDYTCHLYDCYTVESLRTMIRAAKAHHTLPVVGTIPPANPASPKSPPERNRWIAATNDEIRAMADEEGAVVAEVWGALMAEANGDLPSLFVDHVHPNDRGHAIIAQAFFDAITQPRAPKAASATAGELEVE
jgi:lysophospholipase L1-like esterase